MNKIRFKIDPVKKTLNEDDSKKYFSTVGLAIGSFMLLSYLFGFIASTVMYNFVPVEWRTSIVLQIVALVCDYGLALPALVLILSVLPKDTNPSEGLGVGKFIGVIGVAFLFMSVGSSISSVLMNLLSSGAGIETQNPVVGATMGNEWIFNLVFVGIIPPILEELVFRKLICDRLLPLGEGYAVWISAIIFGLAHGNFYQFFYAFLIGLLLSTVYIKTGRVRYGIVLHMLINILGGVFVPWVVAELIPLFEAMPLEDMTNILINGTEEEILALTEFLKPYYLPTYLYFGYMIIAEFIAPFVGLVFFFKNSRKVKFKEGLLPPAKDGKIANIFLNWGVAFAITVFVGMFILSLV